MTPGLFQLMFHSKPQHYTNKDLTKYKQILINSNAHKKNMNQEVKLRVQKLINIKR